MKQRHVSSTPILPLDGCLDYNDNTTEHIQIGNQQSWVQSSDQNFDKTSQSPIKNIARNFRSNNHNPQIQDCVYKKGTKKFDRIEKELNFVKSSWDKEIRFIRYNMEILRNEIDLNNNLLRNH